MAAPEVLAAPEALAAPAGLAFQAPAFRSTTQEASGAVLVVLVVLVALVADAGIPGLAFRREASASRAVRALLAQEAVALRLSP